MNHALKSDFLLEPIEALFATWGALFLILLCPVWYLAVLIVLVNTTFILLTRPPNLRHFLWAFPFVSLGAAFAGLEVQPWVFHRDLFWTIFVRSIAAISCFLAFITLVPFPKMLSLCVRARVPDYIVELLALTHRFIVATGQSINRRMTAQRLRLGQYAGWQRRTVALAHLSVGVALDLHEQVDRLDDGLRLRGIERCFYDTTARPRASIVYQIVVLGYLLSLTGLVLGVNFG